MFRFFLALILASVVLPAHATLLKIDYDLLTALNASEWLLSDPPPDQLHATFTIDTGSALSSDFSIFTAPGGATCLGQMHFNDIAISDIAVTSGSMSLGSIPSSNSGRFAGDNAGGSCPGFMFGSLNFSNDDLGFFGSIDFRGLSQADFESSSDPMAALLTNAVARQLDVALIGDWGRLMASTAAGTIHEVPEPSPLAIFVAAVFGFAASRFTVSGRARSSGVPAIR